MKTHHLKTLQPYFASVADGNKTFELRRNDRDFRIGDTLILEEIDAQGQKTGATIERRVTHILHKLTDKGEKAIGDGFCIMSLAQPLPPVEEGVPSGSGWLPKERVEKLEEALRLIAEDADRSLSNENNRQLQVDGLKVIKATVSRALLETEGK